MRGDSGTIEVPRRTKMMVGSAHLVHVSCENCEASFSLQEREAPPEGYSVRCTVCQHVFRVGPGVAAHEDLGWQIRTSDDLLFTASDVQTLRQWANEGRLQQDDQVSRTGQTWIRLGELPQMASVFQPAPAPVLTPPPAFGGAPSSLRAPTLHSFGQRAPAGAAPPPGFTPQAAPAPAAPLQPPTTGPGTSAASSSSGSLAAAPGTPGTARSPTVLTRLFLNRRVPSATFAATSRSFPGWSLATLARRTARTTVLARITTTRASRHQL